MRAKNTVRFRGTGILPVREAPVVGAQLAGRTWVRRPCYASRRRPGVATIEFALVLPLLLLMMVLIAFFGKGMLNKQDVLMADRQLAWRQAKDLADQTANNPQLLQTYFASQPIGFGGGGGWEASRQSEAALLANPLLTGDSLTYASDVVNNPDTTAGEASFLNVNYQVDITLPPDVTPLSRFAPNISDAYFRMGSPWKYPDVKVWNPLWNCFVGGFDTNLTNRGVGADQTLIQQIRQLYKLPWKDPNSP